MPTTRAHPLIRRTHGIVSEADRGVCGGTTGASSCSGCCGAMAASCCAGQVTCCVGCFLEDLLGGVAELIGAEVAGGAVVGGGVGGAACAAGGRVGPGP